ncbi:MAG: RNA 2',3'-cyclic phosphodiesterase [Desulfosalsimonadaceae bacterium]
MAKQGKNNKNIPAAGEKKIRAFIAVALPGHVKGSLGRLQTQLKQFGIRMKYTDPENIHLTLKFLGDISEKDVDAVSENIAMAAAGFAPIELFAKGLGVFPGIRRPRVLWTGVAGQTEDLAQLHQNIEDAMAEFGFERENRRFTGHLTLGRFKGRSDPSLLAEAILKYGDFASDAFSVGHLHLFESTLTPKGPVYRILSSHPLG